MKALEMMNNNLQWFYSCKVDQYMQIEFISDAASAVIGYENEAWEKFASGSYVSMIHPEDIRGYMDFISEAKERETPGVVEYRLVRRSGEVVPVEDFMSFRTLSDGSICSYSVVKPKIGTLTHQFGVMLISAGDNPSVLEINDKMKEYIRFEEFSDMKKSLILSNMLFIIPDEEKEYFATCLKNAGDEPSVVEHRFTLGDGTTASFMGWVSWMSLLSGDRYVLTYTRDETRFRSYVEKYFDMQLELLQSVYDTVFQLDYERNTIRNIKCTTKSCMQGGIPTETAIDIFKRHLVVDSTTETAERMDKLRNLDALGTGEILQDISFSLLNDEQESICSCKGILIRQNARYGFLCCNENSSGCRCEEEEKRKVSIRTFGYFDIFIDGNPVYFKYNKTKELLALLVDRRGGFVAVDEAIACLWEDESSNKTTRARYRKVLMRMMETLREYGIEDIVEKNGGSRRIITEKVDCDLYNFLSRTGGSRNSYDGLYMLNYSWGEYSQNVFE